VWLISTACHELLDAIPVLVASQEKDGDIVKTDSIADDIADTARYGLKSMLHPAMKPESVELEEQFHEVRKRMLPTVQPPKPGEDWAANFGGRSANKAKR
jgi:hypothetical protein